MIEDSIHALNERCLASCCREETSQRQQEAEEKMKRARQLREAANSKQAGSSFQLYEGLRPHPGICMSRVVAIEMCDRTCTLAGWP